MTVVDFRVKAAELVEAWSLIDKISVAFFISDMTELFEEWEEGDTEEET